MSTRCSIIIKPEWSDGKYIYLYHYHDGNPEGVGANLLNYLMKEWSKGWWYADTIATDLVKGKQPSMYVEFEGKFPDLKVKRDKEGKAIFRKDDEYEVASEIHGDIDYLYVINCKARTLRCVKGKTLKDMRKHLVPIYPQVDFYEGNVKD